MSNPDDHYKVSCITSIYNGKKWIQSFIDDILKQTIFEDIEFIFINANSPERTGEEKILLEYVEKYKNLKYTRHPEDPGVYAIWNMGIKNASAKYISNWNLDDKRHPEHLEKHVKCLDENPEIDLAYSDVMMTCTKEDTFEKNNAIATYNMPEYSFENLIKYNMPHNAPVWRKSIHDKHGFFKTDMISAADFDMWLRVASVGGMFKRVDGILGLYYKNPEGISTKKNTLEKAVSEVNELRKEYSGKADYRNFIRKI